MGMTSSRLCPSHCPPSVLHRSLLYLGSLVLLSSVAVAADAPHAVTWQPLGELLIQAQHEAPAAAQSLNESRIASEVTAVVRTIRVQVGEVVDAGATLVELDPRDAQLALERAQAALVAAQARIRLAEFQLQRARELHERNFASADTLTQRETELALAQAERAAATAQVASAQRDLDKCTIRAPYRAIIHARSAQLGELAAPGSPLLTLIDVSRIEVSAQIQPKDSTSLQAADDIQFVAPGTRHAVQLLRISPAIDRTTRTREARLLFRAEAAAPGTTGAIRWQGETNLLPADLVSRRNGRLGVFIVTGDTARFAELEQAQEGRPAAVTLPPATPVIVDGRFSLQDGQKITASRAQGRAGTP